jgi:hypothetical protein
MKKVGFEALIKEINSKSLVSGDKATRVVLEFDSSKALETLNALNELHVADKTVAVAIAKIK